MKAIAVIMVALLFVLMAGCFAVYINEGIEGLRRFLSMRRQKHEPWRVDEKSNGEQVVLKVIRPGEEPLLIGAAAFAAIDFDQQLANLRAEAAYRCTVLNDRKELKR